MYAFGEMADHVSMPREFYAHFMDLCPGVVGLEGCEWLFAHLKNKKIISAKFSVRNVSAIQQAAGTWELDNVYWLPEPSGRLNENQERRGAPASSFGIRHI